MLKRIHLAAALIAVAGYTFMGGCNLGITEKQSEPATALTQQGLEPQTCAPGCSVAQCTSRVKQFVQYGASEPAPNNASQLWGMKPVFCKNGLVMVGGQLQCDQYGALAFCPVGTTCSTVACPDQTGNDAVCPYAVDGVTDRCNVSKTGLGTCYAPTGGVMSWKRYQRISGYVLGQWNPGTDPSQTTREIVTDNSNINSSWKDSCGMVQYKAEVDFLTTVDPTKSNKMIVWELVNRGNKNETHHFNNIVTQMTAAGIGVFPGYPDFRASAQSRWNTPRLASDAGDPVTGQELFQNGWTLAFGAWEGDVNSPDPGKTGSVDTGTVVTYTALGSTACTSNANCPTGQVCAAGYCGTTTYEANYNRRQRVWTQQTLNGTTSWVAGFPIAGSTTSPITGQVYQEITSTAQVVPVSSLQSTTDECDSSYLGADCPTGKTCSNPCTNPARPKCYRPGKDPAHGTPIPNRCVPGCGQNDTTQCRTQAGLACNCSLTPAANANAIGAVACVDKTVNSMSPPSDVANMGVCGCPGGTIAELNTSSNRVECHPRALSIGFINGIRATPNGRNDTTHNASNGRLFWYKPQYLEKPPSLCTQLSGYTCSQTDPNGIPVCAEVPFSAAPSESGWYWSSATGAAGQNVSVRIGNSASLSPQAFPNGTDADRTWVLCYQATGPMVDGMGLPVIRDTALYFKRSNNSDNPFANQTVKLVAWGLSQSARLIKDVIYRGYNAGRDPRDTTYATVAQVFDGAIPFAAGARRTNIMQRWAMTTTSPQAVEGHTSPLNGAAVPENNPPAEWPFTYPVMAPTWPYPQTACTSNSQCASQTCISGYCQDGILNLCLARGNCPMILHEDTETEVYQGWAAYVTMYKDRAGNWQDVPNLGFSNKSDIVRVYMHGGAQHIWQTGDPSTACSLGGAIETPNTLAYLPWLLWSLDRMNGWLNGQGNIKKSKYMQTATSWSEAQVASNWPVIDTPATCKVNSDCCTNPSNGACANGCACNAGTCSAPSGLACAGSGSINLDKNFNYVAGGSCFTTGYWNGSSTYVDEKNHLYQWLRAGPDGIMNTSDDYQPAIHEGESGAPLSCTTLSNCPTGATACTNGVCVFANAELELRYPTFEKDTTAVQGATGNINGNVSLRGVELEVPTATYSGRALRSKGNIANKETFISGSRRPFERTDAVKGDDARKSFCSIYSCVAKYQCVRNCWIQNLGSLSYCLSSYTPCQPPAAGGSVDCTNAPECQ